MIEINLENYQTKQILGSYEFIFLQYLGGQLTPSEMLKTVPTPYIFGEVCTEIRMQYLAREDASEERIAAVEESCIKKLVTLMNVPERDLLIIYKQLLVQIEKKTREIRKNNLLTDEEE